MDDLISRQAAIDAIERNAYRHTYIDQIVDIIKGLPSAQPEQRWIPVSERLPEDYEDVLVWFEYFRYGAYNSLYQMHGIGSYSTEYDSWMINRDPGWHKVRVIAWMPLPEPYREERTEE